MTAAVKGLDRGRKAALIISECQNGITNAAYGDSPLIRQVTERGIVPRIANLARHFRAAGLPVIHCTITGREGFRGFRTNCVLAAWLVREGKLVEGTPYGAVHDELPLGDGDLVSARHHGMSPFTGTDLHATLRGFEVDTVVLAGVSTNIALPGAATEAVGLGYDVVLAEDCTAGGTIESHHMQVTMHFPLLAAVSDGEAIANAIGTRAMAG